MKAKMIFLGLAGAGMLFATACGAATSSSVVASVPVSAAPSSSAGVSSLPAQSGAEQLGAVYRGQVTEMGEGQFTVEQMAGYDYGQPAVVFITDDATAMEENAQPQVGMFVEVLYNGQLSKSIPAQAAATSVTVLATQAEGAVLNGTIQVVEKTDEGFRVELVPIAQEGATGLYAEPLVVLNLPADALENLTEEELVVGAEVSAVTMGVATASLPPQVPVAVLLPYSA